MTRIVPLIAATATAVALIPTAAAAATWKGVVVAKDPERGTVATASGGGAVRTVHAPGRLGKLRLGQRVRVDASRRADGTFQADAVRVLGKARDARVRGVVVGRPAATRALIAAGDEILSIRLPGRRAASVPGDNLLPGDEVDCDLGFGGNGLVADEIDEVGRVDHLELKGILVDASDGTLALAVVRRGLVTIGLPPDWDLSHLTPGDVLGVLVSIDEEGGFLLEDIWPLGAELGSETALADEEGVVDDGEPDSDPAPSPPGPPVPDPGFPDDEDDEGEDDDDWSDPAAMG